MPPLSLGLAAPGASARDGATILRLDAPPTGRDGRIGDFALHVEAGVARLYGPKTRVGAGWGPPLDLTGAQGWTPRLALTADGARRVMTVAWTGGVGAPPASGYLGATGVVAALADALDLRGAQGAAGVVDYAAVAADISAAADARIARSGDEMSGPLTLGDVKFKINTRGFYREIRPEDFVRTGDSVAYMDAAFQRAFEAISPFESGGLTLTPGERYPVRNIILPTAANGKLRRGVSVPSGSATIVAVGGGDPRYLCAPDRWVSNSIYGSSPWDFQGVVFDAAAIVANAFVHASHQSRFTACQFIGATENGCLFTRKGKDGATNTSFMADNIWTACTFKGNGLRGFKSEGPFDNVSAGPTDSSLIDCVFNGASVTEVGLELASASNWKIRNNRFYGATVDIARISNLGRGASISGNSWDGPGYVVIGKIGGSNVGAAHLAGDEFFGKLAVEFSDDNTAETFVVANCALSYRAGTPATNAFIEHRNNRSNKRIVVRGGFSRDAAPFTLQAGNTLGVYDVRGFTAASAPYPDTSMSVSGWASIGGALTVGGAISAFGNMSIGANTWLTASFATYADAGNTIIRSDRARGSTAAPAAVQAGDVLGEFYGRGYTGSAFANGGGMRVLAASSFASTVSAAVAFEVYDAGTFIEAIRIVSSGNVGVGTSSPAAKLDVAGPIRPKSYSKAALPSAAAAGSIIYVTDDVGGATLAFADGTAWRRAHDLAVVA